MITRNVPAKWTIATSVTALLLLFAQPRASDASDGRVHMKFMGANQSAPVMPRDRAPVQSMFLREDDHDPATKDPPAAPVAWYRGVYPGIDMVCFADDFNVEYAFVVAPGGDISLLKFGFGHAARLASGHAGSVVIQSAATQMVQGAPAINFVDEDGKHTLRGRAVIGPNNTITLDVAEAYKDQLSKLNNTRMNIVPAGGQPGGPRYDFFAARLETSNNQFLRFLNDAQQNLNAPRGGNMFFDDKGNVWINPAMKAGRDEMFSIAASQLTYDPGKPEGERYSHRRPDNRKDPFADHPVGGVSWLGAVKYANWLTIAAGRGIAERCYTEGPSVLDWAPTTATNWAQGTFSEAERQLWLSSKGFRLPMVNGDVPAVTTNFYNEFYKAASWNRTTNTVYGFGRNTFGIEDGNALTNAAQRTTGTTPTGYYDGKTFLGLLRTRPNQNIYGLFDLSGNVAEWTTDFARKGSAVGRISAGGSFKEPLQPVYRCAPRSPSATDSAAGFRMFTTYMPKRTLYIHVLFSFYAGDPAPLVTDIPDEEPIVKRPPEEGGAEVQPERYGVDVVPPAISYKPEEEKEPPEEEEEEPPSEPPIVPPGPARQWTLTVRSTNPNNGVNVSVNPSDLAAQANGTTSATFTYNDGTTVALTAPPWVGGNQFLRWRRLGLPDNTNLTVNILMNQDITMIADYGSANLAVSLMFTVSPIDISDPIGTTYLIATPSGGTPPYILYEYQYVLAHHVFYTNWQPSVLLGPTNTFDWNYSIRYQVRVMDSTLTWSNWAQDNLVVIFVIPPVPITQIGL